MKEHLMNIRISALVAAPVVVATVVGLWLSGAFDGESPIAGAPQPAPLSVEVDTPSSVPTTTTMPLSTGVDSVELAPPSSSVTKELESIGYAYDAATGTWQAKDSIGLPTFVLEGPEGSELVVKVKKGKLVCDVLPPFDQRPAALTVAMSGMDAYVPADATAAKPTIVEYKISGVRVGIFPCYRT
jgi:hypothetical protein